EGHLRSQACDGDDDATDGSTRLRVPDGLEDGNYILRETFTANGGVPADDQRLALGPGRFEATAMSLAAPPPVAPTTEPTAEPTATEVPTVAPTATEELTAAPTIAPAP